MTRNSSASPKKDARTGKWFFVVDAGPSPNGRRRQVFRRGFSTKAAAQEELDKVRGAARTDSYVAPAKLTLAEYLEAWVEGLPASGLRPSTVDSYGRTLRHVTDDLGGRRVDRLTAIDLDRCYSRLLSTGRRNGKGGLSPRSVRYVHTIVLKALGDGVRKGVLAKNAAQAATAPSPKSTRAPEMKWWTPAQLRQFLTMTADEHLGPLFRLTAMTGLRRGEVCGLRWSDVDLEKARLEVRQQIVVIRGEGHGGLVFQERTKTDHGRRGVDLDAGTVAVLKAQRARQSAWRLQLGAGWSNEHDLVFTDPTGGPLDPESVANVFMRRVARSGLPRLRFHDLRHSHVAHLIGAGEQPLLIAKRLGHASAAFTQDRYGHLFEDAGSQAASAVARMVDGL